MDIASEAAGKDRLIGACVGISILADILIQTGLINQEELGRRLTEAILLTQSAERQMPLRSILWLTERFSAGALFGDEHLGSGPLD